MNIRRLNFFLKPELNPRDPWYNSAHNNAVHRIILSLVWVQHPLCLFDRVESGVLLYFVI
jgi:hypothetical protein